MSVYRIAAQEAARVAQAAAGGPASTPPSSPAIEPTLSLGIGAIGPQVGKALDSIGTYIPTEVMATYLAILAIVPAVSGGRYQWLMFWGFLVATPVVVWLGVAAAHPGQGLSLSVTRVKSWPWLSMFAASLAFLVFAIGVPGSVIYKLSWYEPWMTTAAIILSAFLLSQINRVSQALVTRTQA